MSLLRKYIPQTWSDIVGQDEIVSVLSKYTKIEDLPHLMFSGPPGCGKTACAYVLAYTLNIPVIELNASDERGIDTIREKVKTLLFTSGDGRLILMEEADALCLSGNTEIIAEGSNVRIEDVVNKEFNTISYDFLKKKVVESKAECINTEYNFLYKVTLDDGRKIFCSINQPFFGRFGNVKRLKELKEGDEIATFDD